MWLHNKRISAARGNWVLLPSEGFLLYMVNINLLGATIDSTLLFQIIMPILAVIGIILAYLNYRKKPANSNVLQSKLNEIDRQLTDLYKPMDTYIREYISTVSAASNDPNLLDMNKRELERKLGELQTKYPGRIDMEVIKFSSLFLVGTSPPEVFRHAVGIKIRNLQTERENLIKKLEKKGL